MHALQHLRQPSALGLSLRCWCAGFADKGQPSGDTNFQKLLKLLQPMSEEQIREASRMTEEERSEYARRAKEYSRHRHFIVHWVPLFDAVLLALLWTRVADGLHIARRLMMREHRLWQKDLSTKLKLKKAAIAALPTQFLRDAAMVEDLAPFPAQRQVWTHTPAIPHWEERKKETGAGLRKRVRRT